MRKKTACVTFSGTFGGSVVLGKNRDRNYIPHIMLVHLEFKGTEMAILFDTKTGWCEGINEHGIGVVNSTLVVADISEIEKIQKGDYKSNGPKILAALAQKNPEDALQCLKLGNLEGHTFVGDKNTVYQIENPENHILKVSKVDLSRLEVRTNHGYFYQDAGYHSNQGSLIRWFLAHATLTKALEVSPDKVFPRLTATRPFLPYSNLNPVKDHFKSDKMRTTSQLAIDLSEQCLHIYLLPGRVDFDGTVNLLGRAPKIPIAVHEYPESDFDRPMKDVVVPTKKASVNRVASHWLTLLDIKAKVL